MTGTIFALASAQGRAGVSVVRLSGPGALLAAQSLVSRPLEPRRATYAPLVWNDEVIDQAVVIWFKAPNSFTGEDCVELHVHGSYAVLDRLYEALTTLGLQLAGPGEFSRRAVQNGKLDLTQAEGIADLVDAETDAQRRQALTQLDGGLSACYQAWRDELVQILARLEVFIDFPDEDLPIELSQAILERIAALRDDLTTAIADSQRGQQVREGFRIVILGEPNAGKSSLFNRLLSREAAIVTPIAGTTRDVIEAQLKIGGFSVLLYDTAGLRDSDDAVEAEGIRRARRQAEHADLRLWAIDASRPDSAGSDVAPGDIVVFNKADLIGVSRETSPCALFVSTRTGEGIEALIARIEEIVTARLSQQTFPAATRQRHIDRLTEARDHLAGAVHTRLAVPELTAEHARAALNSFEALFGRYDVERVLDVVFSTFCIGK